MNSPPTHIIILIDYLPRRATHGSTMNFGSHSVFVEKQLMVLEKEDADGAEKESNPTKL